MKPRRILCVLEPGYPQAVAEQAVDLAAKFGVEVCFLLVESPTSLDKLGFPSPTVAGPAHTQADVDQAFHLLAQATLDQALGVATSGGVKASALECKGDLTEAVVEEKRHGDWVVVGTVTGEPDALVESLLQTTELSMLTLLR